MNFAAGARLGPFEILEPPGRGGLDRADRARDTRLDRDVAIKLLPSDIVNARRRTVERFRLEARAIARTTGPDTCTLHNVGEDDSMDLVMEYVPPGGASSGGSKRPDAAATDRKGGPCSSR
jgi:eukaryotic-like serine/threonine-protein kinase